MISSPSQTAWPIASRSLRRVPSVETTISSPAGPGQLMAPISSLGMIIVAISDTGTESFPENARSTVGSS